MESTQGRESQIGSPDEIPAGKHTVTLSFVPDETKKLGPGGKAILSVNGKQVAELQVPKTLGGAFSFDVGCDEGTHVSK